MMLHLKEMASVSSAIAEGRLNVTVRPRSSRDTMANAFLQMIRGLRRPGHEGKGQRHGRGVGIQPDGGGIDRIRQSERRGGCGHRRITSTMHEMSINVQNVVKSTQMQTSSVAETSASIEEDGSFIQRVADTARTLLEISQRSREEVHTGIETMEKATTGLTRTSSAIRSSSEIIDVLGRRAMKSAKSLRSLTTSPNKPTCWRSTRDRGCPAGEHGLGSRWSPKKCENSPRNRPSPPKEISDLIQGIQKEAREAVENMEKSTAMVQPGPGTGRRLEPGAEQDL